MNIRSESERWRDFDFHLHIGSDILAVVLMNRHCVSTMCAIFSFISIRKYLFGTFKNQITQIICQGSIKY